MVKKFPYTRMVLDMVYTKAPLQKKKIEFFLKTRDIYFKEEFEIFLEEYIGYLNKNNMTIDYGINSYLEMVDDMFRCQIKFMRTGKYPTTNASDAMSDVYSDEKKMLSYMIGLALSQYLWSTHYEMFGHLKSSIIKNKNNINKYLEIGPGHGLFLKNAIDALKDDVQLTAVDISPISLKVSESIISYFYPNKSIDFINADMLNLDINTTYDFIVMGEVIEHVEDPVSLLVKISKLLNKNGKAFLSTCVNCPMIDHVYHFHTVDEIKQMFNDCGLHIESEKILPVEDVPIDEVIEKKITINYSAIVSKY